VQIEELEAEQIGDSQGLSTEAERELKEKKSDLSRERNKLDAAVSAGERRIADINVRANHPITYLQGIADRLMTGWAFGSGDVRRCRFSCGLFLRL
jgi:hypothetical protein